MKYALSFALAGLISLFTYHASAIDLKDISYDTKEAGKVVFSHNKHLAKKSARGNVAFSCATCHTGNKTKNAIPWLICTRVSHADHATTANRLLMLMSAASVTR